MINMETTGAVINTKTVISSSWITSRDCSAVKWIIEAMRMQPVPSVMVIAGPWMR